jgi:hypothetical protein
MRLVGLAHPRGQCNAQHITHQVGTDGLAPILGTGHFDAKSRRLRRDHEVVIGTESGKVCGIAHGSPEGIVRQARRAGTRLTATGPVR